MFKLIPFKLSVYTSLIVLTLVEIFHICILSQLIPFQFVWGGQLRSVEEMQKFELISIVINLLIILIISAKSNFLKIKFNSKFINFLLYCCAFLFLLNTFGNIVAKKNLETIIFTPITFILMICCFRIAREN